MFSPVYQALLFFTDDTMLKRLGGTVAKRKLVRCIACADWPAHTKASLLLRVATMRERSLRDKSDKGGENENPFPTSLNRCNATSTNKVPTEAILMRHSLVYQFVSTVLDRSSKFLFSSLLHNYRPFPFICETWSWLKVSHSFVEWRLDVVM